MSFIISLKILGLYRERYCPVKPNSAMKHQKAVSQLAAYKSVRGPHLAQHPGRTSLNATPEKGPKHG